GGYLPVPAPHALQQEDVIRIKMRPDSAAIRRKTDHQVVEPRVGNKIEFEQQLTSRREKVIDILYQQRPVFYGQAREKAGCERTLSESPSAIPLCNQTRLGIISAGKLDKIVASQQTLKAWKSPTYQQGFLLPVIAEE